MKNKRLLYGFYSSVYMTISSTVWPKMQCMAHQPLGWIVDMIFACHEVPEAVRDEYFYSSVCTNRSNQSCHFRGK